MKTALPVNSMPAIAISTVSPEMKTAFSKTNLKVQQDINGDRGERGLRLRIDRADRDGGHALHRNAVFTSIAVGAMLMVAVALIGSLSILPALLAKSGPRVDRGRIPFLGRRS